MSHHAPQGEERRSAGARTTVVLTVVLVLAAGLVIIAPDERTLGSGIKPVYVHVGLTLAGMAGLIIAGALGLFGLLSSRNRFHAWMLATGRVGLLLYAAGVAASLVAAHVNWGGVTLEEPLLRMSVMLLGVAWIAHLAMSLFSHARLHAALSVVPALFVDTDTFEVARLTQNPDAIAVPPSAVAVIVDDDAKPETVVAAINTEVDSVDALTREQAESRAPGVAEVQQSFSITLLLGWVTVGAVIGFFFLILTTQKLPQLTLLRAVGVPTGRLAAAIFTQILIVIVFALGVGALGAERALAGGGSGISAQLSSSQVVVAGVALLLFGVVALGVSAVRISRLDPVDAVSGTAL